MRSWSREGNRNCIFTAYVLIWDNWFANQNHQGITGHSEGASEEATVRTTETHPTPHEQAAIAMAMHLYFDAHDEEPHVITIQEVEKRYSPWSSKIYSMRNTIIK